MIRRQDEPIEGEGMVTTETEPTPRLRQEERAERRETRRTMRTVGGGSIAEAVAGAAAVLLALLGLVQIEPVWMVTIATILVGAGLLLQGGAVGSRSRQVHDRVVDDESERAEVAGGIGAEIIGGLAVLTLGVLALIDVLPAILVPSAAIVGGAVLMLSAGMQSQLGELHLPHERAAYRGSYDAARSAAGGQVLLGLAGLVLGILALVGFAPLVTSLVAMLVLGASILFSGGALGGRMRPAM